MPGVVFVLVDAMRADHLGCYAGRSTGTPTFDRLAAEGVVFTNAVSQAPSTRPSIGSLMTGLYPSQHGLVDRVGNPGEGPVSVAALPSDVPTLPQVLAGGGYVTAAFLGGNANLKPVFGLTRGFLHVDWRPTTDGTAVTADFERFLAAGPPPRTFSYLHYMDVHHPLPMEIIPSRLDKGLDPALLEDGTGDLLRHYAEAVRTVDAHVGRVLTALDNAGLLEDTIVVVTADHGEELGEHGGLLAHGRTLYRELVHVPLLVRLPGAAHAGRRLDAPVQLVDLFPTLCELTGVTAPPVAGRSLMPVINGDGNESNGHAAYSELLRRDRYSQSVTTRSHHLVLSYLFEDEPPASIDDLRVGARVKVKGQPVQGGSFLPTKVSLKPEKLAKLRGTVEAVDHGKGEATVLGVPFLVSASTPYTGLESENLDPTALAVGDRLSVTLEPDPSGGLRARRLKRRKPGGKAKIEGVVERSEATADDRLSITLLGTVIPIPDDLGVKRGGREKSPTEAKGAALDRVTAGDFVARYVELFDLAADPSEDDNLVESRPDIAQELEGLLITWTDTLLAAPQVASGSVEVDPETLEQLRRMGYLD